MQARVKKVADELGWQPNAALAKQMSLVRQTLSGGNYLNLAIVLHRASRDIGKGWAFRLHYEGAIEYARGKGYSVNIFNLVDEPLSPSRFVNVLKARGIQGIIYIAGIDPPFPIEYLEAGKDFSCSVCGVRYPDPRYHVAIPDWTSAGRIAIQEILSLGNKRPVVIIPKAIDEQLDWGFTSGIAAGVVNTEFEGKIPLLYVGRTESHIPSYEFKRCVAFMKEHRADCLLTTDSQHPFKFIPMLKRKKPLPVYLLDWFEPTTPVKGGIQQWHTFVGHAAVDLVIGQIHRGDSGVPPVQKALEVEGQWTTGEKTDRLVSKIDQKPATIAI